MSTRAMYTFSDQNGSYHVYKHHDGYPTGAADALINALPYAWPLPRFAANDFAAAFVAANKGYWIKEELILLRELHELKGASRVKALRENLAYCRKQFNGGDVYLMVSGNWKDVAPHDLEYRYEVSACSNGVLLVTAYRISYIGETRYEAIKSGGFKAVKVPKAAQGWQETKLFSAPLKTGETLRKVVAEYDAQQKAIDELERPGGCGAQRLGIYWTARSVNKKTGPIPVSTTSAETCPSACPLAKGGCYAKGGNVGILWHALTRHGPNAAWTHGAAMARSIDWAGLCERVSELEPGTMWRHNQAGDLPHRAQRISKGMLQQLVAANKGRRGFTYTHHNVVAGAGGIWNRALVRWANATGFTINLSANDLGHADRLADMGAGPVVVILTQGAAASATPAGRPVKVCPAVVREGVTCKQCQWCAMPDRKWIVGFPAHGSGARAAEMLASHIT